MNIPSFTAIDFETATSSRSSICQIGLAVFDGKSHPQTYSWLVRPSDNRYEPRNISIHGITPDKTSAAPSFAEVWLQVKPHLEDRLVVAHNVSFDMYALRDALTEAHISFPTFRFLCTLRIARAAVPVLNHYTLDTLCARYDIDQQHHHDAADDALCCGQLLAALYNETADGLQFDEWIDRLRLVPGHFSPDGLSSVRSVAEKPSSVSASLDDNEQSKSFDPDNYFYGKQIVFTGKCQYGTREEMMTKTADIGAFPCDSGVTRHTDILIIGQVDYDAMTSGLMKPSSKLAKAIALRNQGKFVEIMSENEFWERY